MKDNAGPTLRRSRARRIAGVLAAVAAAWAALLLVTGGLTFQVAGVRVSMHEPWRPILLLAICGPIWIWNGGGRGLWQKWSRLGPGVRPVPFAMVMTAVMIAVGVRYSATVGGGSDSFGYVSQADLWLAGQLRTHQEFAKEVPWPTARWTFTPLGYVPEADGYDIVPRYSPGLPMLMALAKAIAGQAGMFVVVPVSGGVLVLFTFLIAHRLGFNRTGVIAAWLVATSPVVLFMHTAVMSDVPVAAAWTVAIYCMLGTTTLSAAGCGASAAIALLIRPNLAPQAVVCGLWYLWRLFTALPEARRRAVFHGLMFGLALAPGIVAIAWLNWSLHGSMLKSGYGPLSEMYARANFWPNLKLYAQWLWESQTPIVFAGVAALALPVRWLWPGAESRPAAVAFLLFVLVLWWQYCHYLVFDVWWYLRFLIPSWPFLMIGLGRLIDAAAGRWTPVIRMAVVIAVASLGVRGVLYADKAFAFSARTGEWKYAAVAQRIRERTDANSLIFSMQHSGTIRYYGGRMTLTYTALDGAWLDRALAWCVARGIHPYAALEEWELPEFRKTFATQAAGSLARPPRFIYRGPATIYFYDLAPDAPATAVEEVVETYADLSYASPARPPRLEIR